MLPTVVGQIVAVRGAEELTSWRQPEDLVSLCQTTVAELPSLLVTGRGSRGAGPSAPWRRCGCDHGRAEGGDPGRSGGHIKA